MTVCNTLMAAGMAKVASLIEGGASQKDAVVETLKASRQVIFTGNGYGDEWPIEAAKRGLPNLKTTPEATAAFASEKNVAVFEAMGVYAPDETHARAEVLYENYVNTITVEIETMVAMTKTGFLPACAKDLALYKEAPSLAGDKAELYEKIKTACADLEETFAAKPAELAAEAAYLCDVCKPKMDTLRAAVDAAEAEMDAALYPYPTYEALVYGHHF